jgi:hypothetical protein
MKVFRRYAALLFVSALSLPLFAQTFGEITGRITDTSGAGASDARVVVINLSTNSARETVSTAAGDYTVPSLPPGTYNVRVEKAGF